MLLFAVVEPGQVSSLRFLSLSLAPIKPRFGLRPRACVTPPTGSSSRATSPGLTRYPRLLGHETAGIVEFVGEKARNFRVGDRVIGGLLLDSPDPAYASGWVGFSDYALAGDHQAMARMAWLTRNTAGRGRRDHARRAPADPGRGGGAAVHLAGGLRRFGDFNLQPGDDILVFGGGPVGLSFVKFARLLGWDSSGGGFPAGEACTRRCKWAPTLYLRRMTPRW